MKILLLADARSYHVKKWVEGYNRNNVDIVIVCFSTSELTMRNVKNYPLGLDLALTGGSRISKKWRYLTFVSKIRKIIDSEKPDIIHAHYASSYGVIGALVNRYPFIVSVWGADVYDFPKKSFIHKAVVKYSLSKADKILSTSHCMAKEAGLYTQKRFEITPFGIDTCKFSAQDCKSKDYTLIGTIKSLRPKYGIDKLLRAFAIVQKRNAEPLKLLLVGEGSHEAEYKQLAESLGIASNVEFLGYVDNDKIPAVLNSLDVYVALSQLDSESFGVAAVEAMACEVPVVVSDVDGFKEVVPADAGYIVLRDDYNQAADAIEMLVKDADLRKNMGKAGREHVLKNYDFEINLKQMLGIYDDLLGK